jgi:hypothetical protein
MAGFENKLKYLSIPIYFNSIEHNVDLKILFFWNISLSNRVLLHHYHPKLPKNTIFSSNQKNDRGTPIQIYFFPIDLK